MAPESGVSRVSDSLLRALAAKARGALVLLDVSAQVHDEDGPLTTGCVLEAVAANGRTLRRLVVLDKSSVVTSIPTVEALLRAAPHLTSADADVYCPSAQALLLLRGEAPFGALRVRKLEAKPPWAGAGAVAALARAVAAHPSLAWLSLDGAPLQPGTDALAAVVDVAVGKGLARLDLVSCGLDAAAGAAQLARLLRDDPRLGSA